MDFRCPLCGKDRIHHAPGCPFLRNMQVKKELNEKASEDLFGAVPNVFVGQYGYPNINVGFLTAQDKNEKYDSPKTWVQDKFSIPEIVDARSSLVNSNFKANVKKFDDRLQNMSQELSLAIKPVDVEVNLTKKPEFKLNFGGDVIPYGPSVNLKKATVTENPKIPRKVESLVDDPYVGAASALTTLTKKGFDQHYLTKVFSVGNLGKKPQRKLVPTRWSITAVDDTIGKHELKTIKDYSMVNDYEIRIGEYFGNYFMVIFLPRVWSYELFEFYVPSGTFNYTTDYEYYAGRKNYVEQTAGGYYASRLPILNHLVKRKRQATVLVLRFVTTDYYVPLGVWVVREAVKKAMKQQPLTFQDLPLLLRYVENYTKKKFLVPITHIFKKSKILQAQSQQTLLSYNVKT